jgi:Sec-independent protein secretion pathway component TatC
MIVMMLPLFGLYELSIWLSYMARRSGGSAWEDYS